MEGFIDINAPSSLWLDWGVPPGNYPGWLYLPGIDLLILPDGPTDLRVEEFFFVDYLKWT